MKKTVLLLCGWLLVAPLCALAEPMPAARTIILVRHGVYVPEPDKPENPGPHLAPLGVAQAKLVGARLAGLPTHLDTLYVSPMTRARDTAATIAEGLPGRSFKVLEDLTECTPPTRRREVMEKEKPADLAACKQQLDRLFASRFTPARGAEQTDLMVCHGNVIRFLVTRALGVDSEAWLEMSVSNASISEIRIEADGRFKVISVGDVGHLPTNMLTGASGDSEHSLAIPVLPTR